VNERLTVFAEACPRFVEFVEAGVTDSPEVLAVAEEYLAPLRPAGVDTPGAEDMLGGSRSSRWPSSSQTMRSA